MKKLMSLHLRDNDVGALTQQVQQGIKAPAWLHSPKFPSLRNNWWRPLVLSLQSRTVDGPARCAAHESASSQGGKIVYVK